MNNIIDSMFSILITGTEPNKHPKYGNKEYGSRRNNGCKRKVVDYRKCEAAVKNSNAMSGCYKKNNRYHWYNNNQKWMRRIASKRVKNYIGDISNGCWFKKMFDYIFFCV